MSRLFLKAFYSSAKWKKVRADYVKSRQLTDGGLCEVCRVYAGKEVHHITPLDSSNISDDAVAYGFDNLKFLCRECHFRTRDDEFQKYYLQKDVQNGAFFEMTNNKLMLKEQKVIIVYGSPCAGKIKYVKRKFDKENDFLLNMSKLWGAFTLSEYEQPLSLFSNICDIYDSILDYIKQLRINAKRIWIVGTLPNKKKRDNLVKILNAELVHIDTNKEECIVNCYKNKEIKNKNIYLRLISKYFDDIS